MEMLYIALRNILLKNRDKPELMYPGRSPD